MVSIRTNLSSQITQSSLTTSTSKLNKAIERLTTGAKINNASDNAANYSISNNLSTQISAYQVAEDNVSSGISLLQTASDTVDLMYSNLSKIRSIAVQAANSTLSSSSLLAMNKEVSSLINEMYRTKFGTNYDGISLLGENVDETGEIGASVLEVNSKGFIKDIEVRDVSGMTSLASVDETQKLAQGTYSISSASELAKLATMQNAGLISNGSEFVLGSDIDLSDYSEGEGWVCIGNLKNAFQGSFDGNGYTISNLYISRSEDYQGLFGYTASGTLQNISIKGGSVSSEGDFTGGLVGEHTDSYIINCNTSVNVNGTIHVGGLSGAGWSDIDSCYTTGSVSGENHVGGLVGMAVNRTISNCFTTGEVNIENGHFAGGLIGYVYGSTINNCYSTSDIYASKACWLGGLVGLAGKSSNGTTHTTITNCNATGNITATPTSTSKTIAGGLVGTFSGTIENCYATGDINSSGNVNGGLIGAVSGGSLFEATNCYATGDVITTNDGNGGLIGMIEVTGDVTNCFATGNVSGNQNIGGLVGYQYTQNVKITDSYATGDVTGTNYVGGLIGSASTNSTTTSCYATGNVTGLSFVGGLIGFFGSNSKINDSYTLGTVTGDSVTSGGLIGAGGGTITNCYVLGKSSNLQNVIAGSLTGTASGCKYSSYYDEAGISLVNKGSATITDCEVYDGDAPFSLSNDNSISFQVGINGTSGNSIKTDTSFSLGNLRNILYMGIENSKALGIIDDALSTITAKQTEYGTLLNRFDSALDEISTKYENLVSTRSTLQDADISKTTSEYIRQQILQQASATLLATANQNPSIALQLI